MFSFFRKKSKNPTQSNDTPSDETLQTADERPEVVDEPAHELVPTSVQIGDDGKERIKFVLDDSTMAFESDIDEDELARQAMASEHESVIAENDIREREEELRREEALKWQEEDAEDEEPDAQTPEAQATELDTREAQTTTKSIDEPELETPETVLAPEAVVQEPDVQESPVEAVSPVIVEPLVTQVSAPEPEPKQSWLKRLKQGLSRTGSNISSIFVGVKVDENLFEDLETALIMADSGIEATESLLDALRARVKKERITDAAQVKIALKEILADHLRPLEKDFGMSQANPLVIMIAGVNGAGKTTSIGKLANHFQAQGAKVLLAAGDTFRAAAREQLVVWGSRNNVDVISQDGGDPAAVAFDAVNAGKARNANVVMIDTAGRLPTQLHLMEELKKIKRVIAKADGSAPHEVLLVVDGNTGQNAISQIRSFDAALTLTGLVVTKLDGTAKGGTLAAVAAGSQGVRPIPVYWIGVGETMNDLQPFKADEFAAALLGD